MDLKTLHLEETVVLPKDYKEVIADRSELAPELKTKFGSGKWGNKNRLYKWFCVDIEPIVVRVSERSIDKDEVDEVLYYELSFHTENPTFAPFLKFIKEWGKQNCGKGSKLNERFAKWLLAQCDLPKDTDDELYYRIPVNIDEVMYRVENEADFFIILKEISKAFRILATEHASDPLDLAAEFEYDESELKGRNYQDLANHVLTPMVLRGLIEGLAAFRQKVESGETGETIISIEVKKKKKTMLFYYGADCKGTPFYEFEIGSVLSKCLYEMRSTSVEYDQALSHWFTDAARNLPEKAYRGMSVTVEVPETGGDPVFEHFE